MFLGRSASFWKAAGGILALVVSMLSAGVAIWQATDSRRFAEAQRLAAKQATADQVVIIGEPADIPTPGSGGTSFGTFASVPTKVQNYGRLPVSDVTIAVEFVKPQRTLRYLVPVGPLTPCREVSVVDQADLFAQGLLKDVKRTNLRVYFTDPAGYRWERGTSGSPQASTGPPPSSEHNNGDLVRSPMRLIKPCSPG